MQKIFIETKDLNCEEQKELQKIIVQYGGAICTEITLGSTHNPYVLQLDETQCDSLKKQLDELLFRNKLNVQSHEL